MEYLASTWWIWMIVAFSMNFVAIVGSFVCVAMRKIGVIPLCFVLHLVSIVPWIMCAIGAIVAIIRFAMS